MEVIRFIQSFSSPFLDAFFQGITMLGEDPFYVAVISYIFWCIDKRFGYRLGLALLSSITLNVSVKEIFRIPRPIGQPGIRSLRVETAGGYSFPSGHTQNAASFWAYMMLKYRKRWLTAFGALVILLVALSRVYLGVHTPVDVLGGMAFGVLWVLISNAMFDYVDRTGKYFYLLLFLTPVWVGLFFASSADYFKAAGIFSGFLAGYVVESRYIRYEVKAPLWKQIVKYGIGLAGLLVLMVLLKPLLPKGVISDFIRYFLMGLWVTVPAPWLFKRFLSPKTPLEEKEEGDCEKRG